MQYYANNRDYYLQKFRGYTSEGRYKNQPSRYDSEKAKIYRFNNKDKYKFYRHKRKSLLRGSIGDLTNDEYNSILTNFNYKCAFTGSENIHMDHFIPINTGYGYSDSRNLIPLDASLNVSKNAKNPFEWVKSRNDIDIGKFFEVVSYLAELNGLSFEEYEAHVYNCFD